MKTVIIFLIFLVVVVCAFIFIKKKAEKRRIMQTERIKNLSETEEGRLLLEKESEERVVKNEKLAVNIKIIYCVSWLFLFAVSVISLLTGFLECRNIKDVLLQKNGMAPLIFAVFSLIQFVINVKNVKK